MYGKITLYSEKTLIEDMKEYAKMQNTSVSKLVTEFFAKTLKNRKITGNKKKSNEDLLPDSIKKLSGILQGKYESPEEAIGDYHLYLEKKYL